MPMSGAQLPVLQEDSDISRIQNLESNQDTNPKRPEMVVKKNNLILLR